jgi:hypothetical protein
LDSVHIIQPKIRIESPVGAIEADTGNPYIDGFMVMSLLIGLYIAKRLIDKILQ